MTEITLSLEIGDQEVEFTATAEVAFAVPPRGLFGPPEDSSPGESGYVEWLSVAGNGRTFDPDEFEAFAVANGEAGFSLARFEGQAFDAAADDAEGEDDDAGDRAYEDARDREYERDWSGAE